MEHFSQYLWKRLGKLCVRRDSVILYVTYVAGQNAFWDNRYLWSRAGYSICIFIIIFSSSLLPHFPFSIVTLVIYCRLLLFIHVKFNKYYYYYFLFMLKLIKTYGSNWVVRWKVENAKLYFWKKKTFCGISNEIFSNYVKFMRLQRNVEVIVYVFLIPTVLVLLCHIAQYVQSLDKVCIIAKLFILVQNFTYQLPNKLLCSLQSVICYIHKLRVCLWRKG